MKDEIGDVVLSDVTRRIGDRTIVDRVSIRLDPGLVCSVFGPSGAGKSTLLRMVAGLERVDAGEIRCGSTLWASGTTSLPAERRRVGMIFQDFALFPHMSALDNARFGVRDLGRRAALEVASGWLSRVGMAELAGAFPHELSGGEQQRVAIARAFAANPQVMLMDEPFSGLDQSLRERVRHETLSILAERQIPALLVTHDPIEALTVSDKIAVLRDGRLVQLAPPASILREPLDWEIAAAFGPVDDVGRYQVVSGRVITPLGEFDVQSRHAIDEVQVGLRLGGLVRDPGGEIVATVIDAKPGAVGHDLSVAVRDKQFRAIDPSSDASISPGASIRLSVNANRVFAVPSKT